MLFRQNNEQAAAVFHCFCNPQDNWYSPLAAPFGGIQSDRKCTENELTFLLNCVKNWVIRFSGKKLIIKTAPSTYDPEMHLLYHKCYLSSGFTEEHVYSNHFIPVSSVDFCDRIAAAERRRLRKSEAAQFTSGLDFTVSCKTAYNFILESRRQKGYSISISFSRMQQLLDLFPKNFRLFTVKDAGQIIALSLAVIVNKNVLYHFLSADLSDYRQYSPAVMLLQSIYRFCQQQRITVLDLGISIDENGVHKPSLSQFKKNVGGEACHKITYVQDF